MLASLEATNLIESMGDSAAHPEQNVTGESVAESPESQQHADSVSVYKEVLGAYRTWLRQGGGKQGAVAHWYDARALAVMASKREEFEQELHKLSEARKEAARRGRPACLAFALAITACVHELKRDVVNVQRIIGEREAEMEKEQVSKLRAQLVSEAQTVWDKKEGSIEANIEKKKRSILDSRAAQAREMRSKYSANQFKASAKLSDLQRTYDSLMWSKSYQRAMAVKEQLAEMEAEEVAAWETRQADQLKYKLNAIDVKFSQQMSKVEASAEEERLEFKRLRALALEEIDRHMQVQLWQLETA